MFGTGTDWIQCENSAAAHRLRAHLMGFRAGEPAVTPVPAPRLVVPEGLVDVRTEAASLVTLEAPPWSAAELRFQVRPEVAERLERAAAVLPSDIRLGFWEGLRPISIQRSLWDRGMAYLRTLGPQLSSADLETELERYVARPEAGVPPHSTGSAVDVAPVDPFGRILTPEDAWGRLAVEALGRVLRDAGLAHYDPEWWHWSYGDEEWARAYDCAPLAFSAGPEFDGPGGGI
jgi:D-alanyl-D-alanine dipeptidase